MKKLLLALAIAPLVCCGASQGADTPSSVVSNQSLSPPAAPVAAPVAPAATNSVKVTAASLSVTPPGPVASAEHPVLSVQAAPSAPVASNAIKVKEVTRTIVRSSIKTESAAACETPCAARCEKFAKPCNACHACKSECKPVCKRECKCAKATTVCHSAARCHERYRASYYRACIKVKVEKVCRCERRRHGCCS